MRRDKSNLQYLHTCLLQEDKGFDKSLFERQMSVLRGQVWIVQVLNYFYFNFVIIVPVAMLLFSVISHLRWISSGFELHVWYIPGRISCKQAPSQQEEESLPSETNRAGVDACRVGFWCANPCFFLFFLVEKQNGKRTAKAQMSRTVHARAL